MTVLRPLLSRSTYAGWIWLILGGAILMPYMMAGAVAQISIVGNLESVNPMLVTEFAIYLLVLPVVGITGLVLPVRSMSLAMARTLLGVEITDAGSRSWERRWRDAVWFGLHLAVGGLVAGATLALVPFVVLLLIMPLLSDPYEMADRLLTAGWQPWWGLVVGPAMLLALVYATAAVSAGMRWCAPRLLGPTTAELLAVSRSQARTLAARNRIARELHDSIGHALSVVTVQAAAAGRVLDTDPGFVRQALSAVEDTARLALEDLDTVLGVLREDGPADTAPSHTLAELPQLLDSCGVAVTADLANGLDELPSIVSREAYRIVQESLTNALRHSADTSATVSIRWDGTRLGIEVTSPIRPDAALARPGRGITGMTERASVLGGELTAGPHDGHWRVTAGLPVGS